MRFLPVSPKTTYAMLTVQTSEGEKFVGYCGLKLSTEYPDAKHFDSQDDLEFTYERAVEKFGREKVSVEYESIED
jgi:hypothetical protein